MDFWNGKWRKDRCKTMGGEAYHLFCKVAIAFGQLHEPHTICLL